MKNSQQHFGNEANITLHKNINIVPKATFSLSHDFIFLKTSPLLGRFLVSFNLQSAICSLQSAVCSLQSAVCGLQPAVCSLQSAICSLRSAVCKYTENPTAIKVKKKGWEACGYSYLDPSQSAHERNFQNGCLLDGLKI